MGRVYRLNLYYLVSKEMKKEEIESTIEELSEWKHQQEKEEAIRKATHGRIMLRCTTVILSIWTAMIAAGTWAVDHFNGLQAAIKVFIATEYSK